MTSSEVRQKFLDFFKEKRHAIIPSSSLLPENDPTTLFISAGMHPLVPYLLGEKHPEGNRLADVQKCIRTIDIDEVGDKTHHTFFEMLGNWSLGDYFKKESLEWSLEFLTDKKWLGLDKNLLAVSVFEGDENALFDEEAYKIWIDLGIPESKIAKLDKKENWWGPAGQTGPCGPDSEIFYWTGGVEKVPENFDPEDDRWVEVWNNVFMQYNKNSDGKYKKLAQQNIDTGMGLERTTAIMNGLDDDYKTDLFENIIKKIEELSGKKYDENKDTTSAMRIIADHIKASVFIIMDGVHASNVDQGYILRRLIRRAIVRGRKLGIENNFTSGVAEKVFEIYRGVDWYDRSDEQTILEELNNEEKKFRETLEKGLKQFEKLGADKIISGKDAFVLFSTYGFPLEMTEELAEEKGVSVDTKEFEEEMAKHQELSRTASAGKFKSGLADTSEDTKKLHTAAHLLLAALRKVLGDHVVQKGSNITAERLRFDFSHSEKLTDEQKQEVEKLVNEVIEKEIKIVCEEMTIEKARESGAHGTFDYGDKVKVYGIDSFSQEICSGPHVENTGELGKFKIKKEQSSSAGVRRIKAILE